MKALIIRAVGFVVAALLVYDGTLVQAQPAASIALPPPRGIVQLYPGCNNVALSFPEGTASQTVVQAVTPGGAVEAMWRHNAALGKFEGFSPAAPQASDLLTVNLWDAVWLCVGGSPPVAPTVPPVAPTAAPTAARTAAPTAAPTSTPVPPPTSTPVPPPTPTASPTVSPGTFGDGTFRVGADIPAGTYRAANPSQGCYWERLSGFGGGLGDIIANNYTDDPEVVTIAPGDVGFSSDGCGTWTADISPVTSSPTSPFGDGKFIVGTDIAPGTWRNSDSSGGCYWARLNGFGGTFGDIIANNFSNSVEVVTISPSDVGFESSGCGMWTKIS
jgi:hypothetical protein